MSCQLHRVTSGWSKQKPKQALCFKMSCWFYSECRNQVFWATTNQCQVSKFPCHTPNSAHLAWDVCVLFTWRQISNRLQQASGQQAMGNCIWSLPTVAYELFLLTDIKSVVCFRTESLIPCFHSDFLHMQDKTCLDEASSSFRTQRYTVTTRNILH